MRSRRQKRMENEEVRIHCMIRIRIKKTVRKEWKELVNSTSAVNTV